MNFYTIRCCNCNSVLLNLPKEEIERLNSHTINCESCGYKLTLNGTNVTRTIGDVTFQNSYKYDFNI